VREYFEAGYYPSGTRRAADALQPSGALVKAVLINGAVPLTGAVAVGGALVPVAGRTELQGFGRVQLDNTLPLAGGGAAARRLYVVNNNRPLAAGSVHTYCVAFDPATPLKARPPRMRCPFIS
jgi:hypothetical protein